MHRIPKLIVPCNLWMMRMRSPAGCASLRRPTTGSQLGCSLANVSGLHDGYALYYFTHYFNEFIIYLINSCVVVINKLLLKYAGGLGIKFKCLFCSKQVVDKNT